MGNYIYGLPERDPVLTDVLYNAAVLIARCGKAAGTYRKVHPFASEKTWCRAGCDLPVFENHRPQRSGNRFPQPTQRRHPLCKNRFRVNR